MKPFQNCFATDIDLSFVGLKFAANHWREKHATNPTILWIAEDDETDLTPNLLQLLFELGLAVKLAKPYHYSQWSLGTEADYGFGSHGT